MFALLIATCALSVNVASADETFGSPFAQVVTYREFDLSQRETMPAKSYSGGAHEDQETTSPAPRQTRRPLAPAGALVRTRKRYLAGLARVRRVRMRLLG
jgi:hypothetical protein